MTDFAVDVVTAAERTTPPTVAGIVKVYTKDVGGVTQAHALMGNGLEVQLTPPTFTAQSISFAQRTRSITIGPKTTTPVNGVLEPIFPTGRNTITLALGVYMMRCVLCWVYPGTQTSSTRFAFGGTHVSTCNYLMHGNKNFTNTGDLFFSGIGAAFVNTQAAALVSESGNAPKRIWHRLDGIVTVTTAGTFIPQWSITGVINNTYTLSASSFCEITPLGAGFVSQGGWT